MNKYEPNIQTATYEYKKLMKLEAGVGEGGGSLTNQGEEEQQQL
jgi:hypothetical protein